MKKCTLHTIFQWKGIIEDGLVYIELKDGSYVLPQNFEEYEYLKLELQQQRIMICVDGKWGFANIDTGEITVQPIWDAVDEYPKEGPAVVYIACKSDIIERNSPYPPFTSPSRGKWAHVNADGKLLSPLMEYDRLSRSTETDEERYDTAVALIQSEDYWGAFALLSKITHYKDSLSILKKIQWKSCRVGDIVRLGSYWQSRKADADKEDICWVVTAKEKGKAYLASLNFLEYKAYNEDSENRYDEVTWETCTLRAWLNDTFFNNAFTSDEQKLILPSLIKNSMLSAGYTGGPDTTDRIFLPASHEVMRYEENQHTQLSEYTRKQVLKTELGKLPQRIIMPMMLRFPVYNRFVASSWEGKIILQQANEKGAIRPVMWIDLNLLDV